MGHATSSARELPAWFETPPDGTAPARRLEVWPDGALSIARDLVDTPHRGFHASIKIALSGEFAMQAGSQRSSAISAVMVGPNVEHCTDARGSIIAALLVDPESDEFARLAHWLDPKTGLCVLPANVAGELRERVLHGIFSGQSFTTIWEAVCAELAGPVSVWRKRDARISKTAAYLKQNFVAPPSVAELAGRVDLSVSRFVHLFTEGMGVSLRTYVHWLRLRDVLYALANGESLTRAAHRAGFADLPHLTRKFRDMFGEAPSNLGRGDAATTLSFVHRVPERSAHSNSDSERIEELLKGAKSARV